ncbi:UDP-N-acetylmuramoyl-L-alanine--D-glutamate ligase [Candidatus Dependentiae bacterium]|nr:MAG: UDP-N-acetylmuramoyl-L-alanine--D-glutamate ligase [Candidatus Dependentiae bacterium]
MIKKKIIGVWGYGKVGKSLVTFWTQQGWTIYVMDQNPSVERIIKIDFPKALFFRQPEVPDHTISFFVEPHAIYVSPGVDIRYYYPFLKDRLKTELDLFFTEWQKPVIAITGSVGKTTVTSFLSSLLHSHDIEHVVGGNIGNPMLGFLEQKATYAVLELSSFQLEYSSLFCPTIAVWTNFYPNHLDRHVTEESYFKAKYKILSCQSLQEKAIVPTSIIPYFNTYGWPKSTLYFIADEEQYSRSLPNNYPLFMYKDNGMYFMQHNQVMLLCKKDELPAITIANNWLFLAATLYALDLFNQLFVHYTKDIKAIPHRTEFVTTINSLTFVNDSKSTTVASTLAAIEQYKDKLIILLVGGLSKGVDRSILFKKLPSNVVYVVTFGAEAAVLKEFCKQYSTIEVSQVETVEQTVTKAIAIAKPKSIILFSPAGSSYDLYANYQERGDHFKDIVLSYKK